MPPRRTMRPHTTPPQLPEWVLRQLQCPFQAERTYKTGKSVFYCPKKATRAGCPFGHQNVHTKPPSQLTDYAEQSPYDKFPEAREPEPEPPSVQREPHTPGLVPIPADLCIAYLLGRCITEVGVDCASAHLSVEELKQKFSLVPIIPERPVQPPPGVVIPTTIPTATPTPTPTTQENPSHPDDDPTEGTSTPEPSMFPIEPPQPCELLNAKKLAVLVLIGLTGALIIISTVIFLYQGFFDSLCATRVGLLCERVLEAILLPLEAYLVWVDHYIGNTTFLMVIFLRSIWTIWLAYKIGAWHVWLIVPFDLLHVMAFVLYWFELNQMRTEGQMEIRDAATGKQQPINRAMQKERSSNSGATTIGTRSTGKSVTEASFLSV